MDGNRRFSREKKMQLREGYVGGGKTIIQVTIWFVVKDN